jgi:Nif-specific regulatory protein
MIALPMRVKEKCIGVIELINKAEQRKFDTNDLEILELLCNQASIAYQNANIYRSAQDTISVLQNNLNSRSEYHNFIAKSPVILDLLHVVAEVAKTNSSVLITGESGVGKELFAEQLHLKSERCNNLFVRVNCAALAPALLESELFGHVKGAFTNAVSDHKGRFEVADKGTLFLDEIGELPLNLQVKLLRVIQSRQFEKVGSSKTLTVDVRIVAATNRNLEEMVEEGTFRRDLYYRLNVLPINIPPLRERKADIEPLADYFLKKFSAETKKNFKGFSSTAVEKMYSYYWPGNTRELENAVERACVLGTPPYVQVEDLKLSYGSTSQGDSLQRLADSSAKETAESAGRDRTLKTALRKFKKAYVTDILQETSWNQTETSKILGIQRTYVSRLLNELHIRDSKY